MRKLLFGGSVHGAWPADVGLMALRAFAGFALALAHGINKLPPAGGFIEGVEGLGFPVPVVFAWAAGLAEFVGGLLLAVGLLTRPAAFFILCTMLTAAFLQHADDPFNVSERAFLYGFVALAFLLTGSGRLGIDALIRRRMG